MNGVMTLHLYIAQVSFKRGNGEVLLCHEDLLIMYRIYVWMLRFALLATSYEYECLLVYE